MSGAPPTKVLVADDHAPVRAGIRLALEGSPFEICAEVADGPSAVAAALRERPDICLLEVHMPGGSGIAAASEITALLPGTAIVMLSASDDEQDLFAAIEAGAAGYLLKDTDPERLPFALAGVLSGEAAIPRRLVKRMVEELSRRRRRRVPLQRGGGTELTAREWEIFELLRSGATTTEAAERLGISQVTVRRHVSEVMRKLDVPDRASAFALLDRAADGLSRNESAA
jgi:DNA-binding NarL/FixJ family response regulator